nr:hypothetical protein [Candidatus Sigynarchaeota archaeon]
MASPPASQETPLTTNEFWKNSEFAPLINHQDLRKITEQDPWQYEVADRLKNFLYRMESKKVVNFRVSGIVLHSASVLCRAKSQTIIEQGSQIQEALVEGHDCQENDGSTLLEDGLDTMLGEVGDEYPCETRPAGNNRITVRGIANGTIDVDKAIDILASGKDAIN